jgi:AGCS family alanine or glycine:cation symporter
MYYLKKGLDGKGMKTLGKILGGLFAVLCVGASFGGGNAFQSNQATVQISSMLGVTGGSSGFLIGLILSVLVGIVIIGGIKRIAKITIPTKTDKMSPIKNPDEPPVTPNMDEICTVA